MPPRHGGRRRAPAAPSPRPDQAAHLDLRRARDRPLRLPRPRPLGGRHEGHHRGPQPRPPPAPAGPRALAGRRELDRPGPYRYWPVGSEPGRPGMARRASPRAGCSRHLLGEQGGLDAVEEALEPADELGLGDPELGLAGGLLADEGTATGPAPGPGRARGCRPLAHGDVVDIAHPVPAGLVERAWRTSSRSCRTMAPMRITLAGLGTDSVACWSAGSPVTTTPGTGSGPAAADRS